LPGRPIATKSCWRRVRSRRPPSASTRKRASSAVEKPTSRCGGLSVPPRAEFVRANLRLCFLRCNGTGRSSKQEVPRCVSDFRTERHNGQADDMLYLPLILLCVFAVPGFLMGVFAPLWGGLLAAECFLLVSLGFYLRRRWQRSSRRTEPLALPRLSRDLAACGRLCHPQYPGSRRAPGAKVGISEKSRLARCSPVGLAISGVGALPGMAVKDTFSSAWPRRPIAAGCLSGAGRI
jgi:hypothetical protein